MRPFYKTTQTTISLLSFILVLHIPIGLGVLKETQRQWTAVLLFINFVVQQCISTYPCGTKLTVTESVILGWHAARHLSQALSVNLLNSSVQWLFLLPFSSDNSGAQRQQLFLLRSQRQQVTTLGLESETNKVPSKIFLELLRKGSWEIQANTTP